MTRCNAPATVLLLPECPSDWAWACARHAPEPAREGDRLGAPEGHRCEHGLGAGG